jgi:hypothetical protein
MNKVLHLCAMILLTYILVIGVFVLISLIERNDYLSNEKGWAILIIGGFPFFVLLGWVLHVCTFKQKGGGPPK